METDTKIFFTPRYEQIKLPKKSWSSLTETLSQQQWIKLHCAAVQLMMWNTAQNKQQHTGTTCYVEHHTKGVTAVGEEEEEGQGSMIYTGELDL